MSAAPQNIEMERNCLGAMMVSHVRATQAAIVDIGLKPEHFYLDRHRAICAAIFKVADAGEGVPDELLVKAELAKGDSGVEPNYPSELASSCPAPGNLLIHAAQVVKEAKWRDRLDASGMIREAVETRDEELLTEAEEKLSQDVAETGATSSPEQLREMAREILEGGAGEVFPFPMRALNDLTAGGLRRSEHHIIAGHSSHGKTAWLDQLLAYWSGEFKVHLYLNEMSKKARVMRMMVKATRVKFSSIALGKLTADESELVTKRLEGAIGFGITDCTGWSASKIAHHIRLNRWDVAAVDMMHLVPHTEEKELAAISRKFTEACRLTDSLVISTAHLNEKRTMTAVKPRPTLGDIRGSGMIKNNADSVAFIWREQDPENGQPYPNGEMILSKVRNGIPGVVPVQLDPHDLNFYALSHAEEPSWMAAA